ncbi:hypothetical protein ACP275_12G069900 [Erythranthe tilingii]
MASAKSNVKPPSRPIRWKPCPSRIRKKVSNKKVIPPKEQKSEGAGIGSKQNSWVWDHFERFEENGNPRASCNYCSQDYAAHPKQHGTGNLINHLRLQCKKYPFKLVDKKQKTLVLEPTYGNGVSSLTLKSVSYSYEDCRFKLVEMIVLDELPFKIVEGEGFRKYSACVQPRFIVPSRMTVARDCMKLYFDEEQKLRSLLKSERICLTTDTWTSIQNINYICLTTHWIDKEWKLQKRILSFCVIPDHKCKKIGKMIENCLLNWEIDKILTITVDNASPNDGAINYVRKNTKGWKTTVLDHEFLHVRCCAHILNLIAKDARLQTFKKCADIKKIASKSSVCLDIETRWNSTYLMLEAAAKFGKAFERLGEDDSSYRMYFALGDKDNDDGGPKSKFWGRREFLLSKHPDPKVCLMALEMHKKIKKYWKSLDKLNFLVYSATVLDPRYKLRFVRFCFNQVYENDTTSTSVMEEQVKKMLIHLYEYYQNCSPCQNSQSGAAISSQAPIEVMDTDDDFESGNSLAFQFAKQMEKDACVQSKSELTRYLEENCENNVESFDLLRWWKENSIRFPILSQLARDVLAIPVSTVASESAFSTSGRILDPYRSSLNTEMVEALVCLQSWLRSKPLTIDI